MGGSIGSTLGSIGRGVSGVLTLGGSEAARAGLGSNNPISQALGAPGTIFTGGASGPTQMPSLFGYQGATNPYVSGPFSLDPNQVSADLSSINAQGTGQSQALNQLAQKQYDQTLSQIPTSVSNAIQQENPSIMESLNANHLLDSSAYPEEIARQQEYLTQNLAIPALQQFQSAQQGALGTQQGFQSGALQRGLSLEDQINNANISKTIGQTFAPQPPSGKSQFGTVAQGVGALAPWAKVGKAAGA